MARTEEPIQQGYEGYHEDSKNYQRLAHVSHAVGDKQIVFGNIESDLGLPHDLEVDRPQHELSENTGKNGGDAHKGVEYAGDKSRQHTRNKGKQQRQPHRLSRGNGHGADRRAGADGAVNRQVGYVKHLVGDINAYGHYAPDYTLSNGGRQRLQIIYQHESWSFLKAVKCADRNVSLWRHIPSLLYSTEWR